MHRLSKLAAWLLGPCAPGLLRVVSWTLNGLDVCTQNAVVRTSEDGQAHNTFWLTKRGTGGLRRAEAGLPQHHSIQSAAEGWGWLAAMRLRPRTATMLCCAAPAASNDAGGGCIFPPIMCVPCDCCHAGKKLTDAEAELLADRVRDFVT